MTEWRRPPEWAKRLGRRARRTSLARRLADRLAREQYRVGTPTGRIERAVSALIRYDLMTADERRTSVDTVVELFFELVRATGAATFVEAGAKDAFASIRAASMDIGDVLAFEANPFTHRRFAARVRDAGVEYELVALTDRPEPVTMYVRRRGDGTAIPDGQASLLVRPGHTPGYERVTVDGVRLDDRTAGRPGPVALWVDVEGATSWVLRGARDTLDRTDVALIEVEERTEWNGQEWLHRDVVGHLVGHGLVPVARDRQSRFQFNVVFVRRSRLDEPAVAAAVDRWRSG